MLKYTRTKKLKLLTSQSNSFLKIMAAPGDKSPIFLSENIKGLKKAMLEAEDSHVDVIADTRVTPDEEEELVTEYDNLVLQVTDALTQAHNALEALEA